MAASRKFSSWILPPLSTLQQFNNMLPPRQPITSISINRTQGGHIPPRSRTRNVERYNCSYTPTAIALEFNLAHSSVTYTLEQSL
jgi:hypothetical protein